MATSVHMEKRSVLADLRHILIPKHLVRRATEAENNRTSSSRESGHGGHRLGLRFETQHRPVLLYGQMAFVPNTRIVKLGAPTPRCPDGLAAAHASSTGATATGKVQIDWPRPASPASVERSSAAGPGARAGTDHTQRDTCMGGVSVIRRPACGGREAVIWRA